MLSFFPQRVLPPSSPATKPHPCQGTPCHQGPEKVRFLEVRPSPSIKPCYLTAFVMFLKIVYVSFLEIVSTLRAGAMPSLSITLLVQDLLCCVIHKYRIMAAFKIPSPPLTSLFRLQIFHSPTRICLSVFLALPLSYLKIPPVATHNDLAVCLPHLLVTSLHHCCHPTGLNLYSKNTG